MRQMCILEKLKFQNSKGRDTGSEGGTWGEGMDTESEGGTGGG